MHLYNNRHKKKSVDSILEPDWLLHQADWNSSQTSERLPPHKTNISFDGVATSNWLCHHIIQKLGCKVHRINIKKYDGIFALHFSALFPICALFGNDVPLELDLIAYMSIFMCHFVWWLLRWKRETQMVCGWKWIVFECSMKLLLWKFKELSQCTEKCHLGR